MTRKEAIELLDNLIGMVEDNHNSDYDTAFKMAITALEQEPKTEQEDDYFRKIVEVAISQLRADRDRLEDELAKREQEPKTGHWEWVQYDYNPKLGNWHCSECRCVVVECVDKNEKGGIPWYKYCPQCGAKMVETKESEG